MPQVFRIGPYWVYFWLNEGVPLEPVHVHVSEGSPTSDATKIIIRMYSEPNGKHRMPPLQAGQEFFRIAPPQ